MWNSPNARPDSRIAVFSVFASVVDELLAEHPFFENRAKNHQEHDIPDVRLHGKIGYAVRGFTVGKRQRQHTADHAADPHHRQAHEQQLEEHARFHVEFAGFDDGRFAHERHRDRHGDQIQRHVGNEERHQFGISPPAPTPPATARTTPLSRKTPAYQIYHHQAQACADARKVAFRPLKPFEERIAIRLRKLLRILQRLRRELRLRILLCRSLRILGYCGCCGCCGNVMVTLRTYGKQIKADIQHCTTSSLNISLESQPCEWLGSRDGRPYAIITHGDRTQ